MAHLFSRQCFIRYLFVIFPKSDFGPSYLKCVFTHIVMNLSCCDPSCCVAVFNYFILTHGGLWFLLVFNVRG